MTTTRMTTAALSALGASLAATCFALVACGSDQGTQPDRASQPVIQRAAADDVAAQVEHRKAAFSAELSRPQHAAADDVELWVEQRKSTPDAQ
jgi:hypothetical protein